MTAVPSEWSHSDDQDIYEDIEFDDYWDGLYTIEYHADVEQMSLEQARFDLAKRHLEGAIDMQWIDHRAFVIKFDNGESRRDVLQEKLDGCPLAITPRKAGHCRWCGIKLTGRRTSWCSEEHSNAYQNNHYWQLARKAALQRDERRCVRCSADWKADLEVNHIAPVVGAHSVAGCHHHLDNLETLHRPCHLEATNAQREAGAFVRGPS